MTALKVVEGGASPRVVMLERATLARAADDMGRWIDALPSTSEWRASFCRARETIVAELMDDAEDDAS